MPNGSCFCGNVRISYEGEPQGKALCHCTDCRKISGSTYSVNLIVPAEGFKVTGSPKSISKTADTGSTITSHFCGDCGSTLFRDTSTFNGQKIVKVGVMDDYEALNEAKPVTELFSEHRVGWVPKTPGTDDLKGMGS